MSATTSKVCFDQVQEHIEGLKIHAMISEDLVANTNDALQIPLCEATDEQILAEIARRKLDVHANITDKMVREIYKFDLRPLGHGASAEVYKVKHRISGEYFACKIIKKDGNMNDISSMTTEIEIMKRVRHRHVVSLYELFESPTCLWMVLELIDGGDLATLVKTTNNYSEYMASRHFRQILEGLHYLHSRGVVHRDVKLENILLIAGPFGGYVKIADFGLSALVQVGTKGYDPQESSKRKQYKGLHERWGTPMFYAPELIEGSYGPQVDIWSSGCVLFSMLSKADAFPVEDNDEHWKSKLFARIRRGQYDKSRMGSVSQDAKDLINSLLEVNPAVRTSASEALKHPWIVNIPAEMESPNSHSERRSSATGTSVDDPFSSQSMLSNRAPPKRRDSLQHAQSLLSSLFGSFGDHSHRAHPPSL